MTANQRKENKQEASGSCFVRSGKSSAGRDSDASGKPRLSVTRDK